MSDLVGDPKIDTAHYGDHPGNRDTPPQHVEVEEHTAGSDHHPARNGRHIKGQIDHAIELDDKIEELKQDVSKANIKRDVVKAKELDQEMNEVMQEREELNVSL